MIEILSKEELLKFIQSYSRYRIAKETGIPEQTLANYVKGRTDIGGMSLDKAIAITEYYNTTAKSR